MPIGGAEDKLGAKTVLRRFLKEAGGADARIVVCATASALSDEIVDLYRQLFTTLGVGQVVNARPRTRKDANNAAFVDPLLDATGIFFTGGNQLKLAQVVVGTKYGKAVQNAYHSGVIVAGTSAGASIVSEHMVSFGSSGETPRLRMGAMAQGLGLLPGVVVDQHFGERTRYGRLMALSAANPHLLGLGIDEDTGAFITDERHLEVIGRGSVFIADLSEAQSDSAVARGSAPLMVSGATVHFLPRGSRFDLHSRALLSYRDSYEDASPTGQSMKQMTRTIAAEGVDDRVVVRNALRRQRRQIADY